MEPEEVLQGMPLAIARIAQDQRGKGSWPPKGRGPHPMQGRASGACARLPNCEQGFVATPSKRSRTLDISEFAEASALLDRRSNYVKTP